MKKPSRSKSKPHTGARKGQARKAALRARSEVQAKTPRATAPRAETNLYFPGFTNYYNGLNHSSSVTAPRRERPKSPATVTARAVRPAAADDREALALLSLPVIALLLAFSLTQAARHSRNVSPGDLATAMTPSIVKPVANEATARGPMTTPAEIGPGPGPQLTRASAPDVALTPAAARTVDVSAPLVREANDGDPRPLPPASARSIDESPPVTTAEAGLAPSPLEPAAAPSANLPVEDTRLAMLAPPPTDELAPPRIAAPPIVASRTDPREEPELCLASPAAQRTLAPSQSLAPAAFGSALAQAARTQTADLVIYNDTYRHIAYPMGDVPALYGVCTDVIIRAYRALGIDLQQRVHESGLGSGDTSIDHRRTEALRRFFARYGVQIAASSFAEDYRPGDVVTYNRPQNRHSRSHIALVSDVIAPSGRYMIVHNRGWGPQLEDALFVDEITGHYRYYGAEQPPKVPVSLAAAGEAAKPCAGAMRGRMRSACLRQAQANSARTHADGTLVRGLGR